jgi:tetratricopeptide (TPR) repeat protein
MEREFDNVRAALRWWIELHDVEAAIQQASMLFFVWYTRGYNTEGQAWLQEILALPWAARNSVSRNRALQILSRLAGRHTDYVVALEAVNELLVAQQLAGDSRGVAWAHIELGNLHFQKCSYAEAWAAFDKGWAEATALGDLPLKIRCWLYGSMAALCEGRFSLAGVLASQASNAFDRDNLVIASGYAQMTLGTAELEEGRYDEAHARLLRVLRIARERGDQTLTAHVLEGCSGIAGAVGQHQRAVRLGGAAAELREKAGAPLSPAWRPLAEHWVTNSREALSEEAAMAAWTAGRKLPLEEALEDARTALPR